MRVIFDVIVIGAGQAGLSMGYYLQKSSLSFLILDKNERIGEVWRNRYDSLVLFTPRSYSSLHGLPLEGDLNGFPTKNEIGDYLERYANAFDLPIQNNTEVQQITKLDGIFHITIQNSSLQCKNVIIASGPFQHPNIPSFSRELSKEIVQLHSSQFKNPSQLQKGTALVVGGGNSGAQIAVALSESHYTYLSVGKKIRFLPLSFGKKSTFEWLDKLGILKSRNTSLIGKRIQNMGDPVFGYELLDKIKDGKVNIKSRTVSVKKDSITFNDGTSLHVDNIIWATGFIPDYSWLDFPNILSPNGSVKHNRGITEVEGLFFLGLPWQHRRGSAALFGVGDDAQYLFQVLNERKDL
ncbi:NAD(P)/FAD-dependent oxidoreductase [Psychrobacillus sp. OK032]|uniref:flavin-containing monooxygenase n=1 Tax=Psychrobacillus sp. OK032 TaxID=1884358 RepID=UPI002100CEDA|nr:NAD(P)/FAD-dependent oxidoreductase [Psychrobacillus sp. OK032]